MFITQIYGTILGAFVNYGVMTSIVDTNRELLSSGNGDSSWSGATVQAYNTNAISWALAKYLYEAGSTYNIVPVGLAIGAGLVIIHRAVVYVSLAPLFFSFFFSSNGDTIQFLPKVRNVSLSDLNFPQFIQYAGYIPYNQSQTCVIFSQLICGFVVQFWLRNYKPRIFKDYSYMVSGAFDGASLTALFILSFAVFGAGGKSVPFPAWWGNNVNGNYDFCPVKEE